MPTSLAVAIQAIQLLHPADCIVAPDCRLEWIRAPREGDPRSPSAICRRVIIEILDVTGIRVRLSIDSVELNYRTIKRVISDVGRDVPRVYARGDVAGRVITDTHGPSSVARDRVRPVKRAIDSLLDRVHANDTRKRIVSVKPELRPLLDPAQIVERVVGVVRLIGQPVW